MIILIAGASHTGKTALAQTLLEKYQYPYLSIDHLKMGLIRSGNTQLTPMDDDKLTGYLWPIVWEKDFAEEYLRYIRYLCLILSKDYIEKNFSAIQKYGSVIEKRLDDSDLDMEALIRDNEENLSMCKRYGCPYFLVEEYYDLAAIAQKI